MTDVNVFMGAEQEPEMITGLPFEKYKSIPALNPSLIKVGLKSMKHLRYAMDHPRPSTDALTLGSACHTAVFEAHELDSRFLIFDGRKDKRTAAYKEVLAKADNEDRLVISSSDMQVAVEMGLAVASDPIVKPLIAAGQAEVSLTTVEKGLAVKGRLDWVMPQGFCDLKTCRDIEAHKFGGAFYQYGYDVSLGLYQRWLSSIRGQDEPCYVLCVEKAPPYDVTVVPVPQPVLDQGVSKGIEVLRRYKKSVETGVWPGVANNDHYWLHTPNWAMDETEIDWGN